MKTKNPPGLTQWLRILCIPILFALHTSSAQAQQGEVRLPGAEYTTSVEDLRVKVLGGSVVIKRTWINGQWYVNPAWADLKLGYKQQTYFESAPGSNWSAGVKFPEPEYTLAAISRANSPFAFMDATGEANVFLYGFDERFFIKVTPGGIRWSDPLGNTIDYESIGKLSGLKSGDRLAGYARIKGYADRNGTKVSFHYDANGNRSEIRDHFGNMVLRFGYTGTQLDAITDRSGRTVQYRYTDRDLTQVTDVLGHTHSYTYDSNHQITSLTDAENRSTAIAYNGSRSPVYETGGILRGDGPVDTDAAVLDFFNSGAGLPASHGGHVGTVTDPLGNTTTWQTAYQRANSVYATAVISPAGKTTTWRHNINAKLIEKAIGSRTVYQMKKYTKNIDTTYDERGQATHTQYDTARNPIAIDYPDGTKVTTTYDPRYSKPLLHTDEAGIQTKYEYDSRGNLLTQTEAPGLPEQRITSWTYDQYGQILSKTRKGSTAQDDATWRYSYDSNGNVTGVTDPIGNQTAYTHDVMGNVLTRKDARGNTTSATYNAAGWRLTMTGALGHTTRYAYDKAGNLIQVTDAKNAITQATYDGNNRLTLITDAQGGTRKFDYDTDGQPTKVTDPNGITTSYKYDADARPQSTTDGNGKLTSVEYGTAGSGLDGLVTALAFPTYRSEYKYDQSERRTQTIQVLDASTRYTRTSGYDGTGNLVSETDPVERTTIKKYDALHRLIQRIDATNGLTHYSYDSRDNLTALTDANGHTTRNSYDRANRLTGQTRPAGETTQYAWDAVGNLITRTDAQGQQRRYTYDAANRRTQETHYPIVNGVLASTPSQTITTTYDERNQITGYDDGTTSASYTWDALGRKTSETVHYGGFSKTQGTSYYPNGLKKSFTYADGTKIDYTYDGNKQIRTIATPNGTINFDSYHWLAPTKITTPGTTRSTTYDGLLRPTGIKVEKGLANSGQVLLDYRYTYNGVSDVLQRETQDGVYGYEYDKLDRLTKATPPASLQAGLNNPNGLPLEQYWYDGVGNRTASHHQPGAWVYNSNNQLLSYGLGPQQTTAAYDANGNRISETKNGVETRYRYNVAQRLVAVTDAGGNVIASYAYDPFGRRIKKTANGQTTYYQYSAEGLVAEYDGSGNMAQSYGWVPGGLWGTNPQFKREAGNTYFYQNDHLGTPQLLTDTSGNVVWSAKAEAFGKTTVDGAGAVNRNRFHADVVPGVGNNLRGPGQYYDEETGTSQNYLRDYDPDTGRFLEASPNPMAMGMGGKPNNGYGYAGGNPVGKGDPFGLGAGMAADGVGSMSMGAVAGATFAVPGTGVVMTTVATAIAESVAATVAVGAVGVGIAGYGGWQIGSAISNQWGVQIGDAVDWAFAPKPAANGGLPPGFWPGDKGAEEWGRRNGVDSKDARGRFHGIKQGDKGRPKDVYGTDPDTGDVCDPNGDNVGNLGDSKRK